MTPQHSTTAYDAARHDAAAIERTDLGRIVVSGNDRRTYLNGLLTNDIMALRPGDGCYTAYLTAQGRMIADMRVYELGDVILITLQRDVKDTVLSRLDQFIFGEDVQLGDVSDSFVQVDIVGPRAAAVVAQALALEGPAMSEALPEHGAMRTPFEGRAATVLRVDDLGAPGFGVLVEAPVAEALADALRRAGVERLHADSAEALRIEAGMPRFHRDMDEDTIPLEAGIEARAISMTKGCYVGQEVIVRVLHRGHGRVARRLVGLRFESDRVPASGAAVRAGDREVGRITSAVMSIALMKPIALAYVHRDFTEPGHRVSVDGDEAVVTELPFVKTVSETA